MGEAATSPEIQGTMVAGSSHFGLPSPELLIAIATGFRLFLDEGWGAASTTPHGAGYVL